MHARWTSVLPVVVMSVVLALPLSASAGSGATQAVVNHGGWWLQCAYSHSLKDDPILLHSQSGASALNDFFANVTTNANSTPNSLVGQQSICTTKADTAAYFAPAAFVGGRQVLPQFSRSYYQSGNFLAVQAYPFGLQLTAGDPNAKGPQSISVIAWNCGANSRFNSPLKTAPYDCTQFVPLGSSGVVGHVNFPQCWDGTPPTGGNDTSHVAYVTSLGVCPAGFPHPLPSLSFRVHFGVVNPLNNDGSIALSLSSGPYFTMHASFINAWDENVLTTLVNSCINAQVSCGRQ